MTTNKPTTTLPRQRGPRRPRRRRPGCTVCSHDLDPVLADRGTHPLCDPTPAPALLRAGR